MWTVLSELAVANVSQGEYATLFTQWEWPPYLGTHQNWFDPWCSCKICSNKKCLTEIESFQNQVDCQQSSHHSNPLPRNWIVKHSILTLHWQQQFLLQLNHLFVTLEQFDESMSNAESLQSQQKLIQHIFFFLPLRTQIKTSISKPPTTLINCWIFSEVNFGQDRVCIVFLFPFEVWCNLQ